MKYDLYDFDGTIYDGDSGIDIIKFYLKRNPLYFFKAFLYGLLFITKIYSKEKFKTKIFSFVTKIDVDKFVDDFWKVNHHKLKDFWTSKKSHKNDVIISASCKFWLEPIAKEYKIKELIATDMDLSTGEVLGNNCHGREKVKLFYQSFPKGIVHTMYTDSVNDLPLIEEAEEGYLVRKNVVMSYYDFKPNPIVSFWRWGWGIYHKNEELWNYLIVGALTTFVSISVKWLLTASLLDVNDAFEMQVAVILSWVIAVLFAYVTNRIYVFKSKTKKILKEMISFFGARVITLLMEMGVMWMFVTWLSMNFKLWTILCQVLIVIFNYVFSKLFVFKK